MSESKRPPLIQRLLRISRPEDVVSPEPARPKTTPVPVHRVEGVVLLPRELLVVPLAAGWAEVLERPGAEAPWFAVLEELVFQEVYRTPAALPIVCTLAQLTRSAPGSGGGLALRGTGRAHVHAVATAGSPPQVHAEVLPAEPPAPDAAKVEPLAAELRILGKQLLRKRPAGPFYLSAGTVDAVREPEGLADLLAAWCDPDLVTRRRVLAAVDIQERLNVVLSVVKALLPPPGSAP